MAVAIVAAVFILAPSAMAQNASHPTVDQFLANPAQVLQQFSKGGPELISLVRDAAMKDPSALKAILGLLANADPDQQMAIGSGLGQAAQLSLRTNQAYANQIQQDLAASGSQNAILAFAGVTGNVQTAATGGGGGGGGIGGPTGGFTAFGGSNNGNSTFGGSNYQTASQNYFTGSGHSFGGGASLPGKSVSPH
jgi:hypothetical protein